VEKPDAAGIDKPTRGLNGSGARMNKIADRLSRLELTRNGHLRPMGSCQNPRPARRTGPRRPAAHV